MKKLILSIMVIALAIPAMAQYQGMTTQNYKKEYLYYKLD